MAVSLQRQSRITNTSSNQESLNTHNPNRGSIKVRKGKKMKMIKNMIEALKKVAEAYRDAMDKYGEALLNGRGYTCA